MYTHTHEKRKHSNVRHAYALEDKVQFSRSVMSDSAIPWTAPHQASLSITNSRSLSKLMSHTFSNKNVYSGVLLIIPQGDVFFSSVQLEEKETQTQAAGQPRVVRLPRPEGPQWDSCFLLQGNHHWVLCKGKAGGSNSGEVSSVEGASVCVSSVVS